MDYFNTHNMEENSENKPKRKVDIEKLVKKVLVIESILQKGRHDNYLSVVERIEADKKELEQKMNDKLSEIIMEIVLTNKKLDESNKRIEELENNSTTKMASSSSCMCIIS